MKKKKDALALTKFAIEQARDSIIGIDKDARIFYVNETTSKSTGYTKEELLSMTIMDIDPNISWKTWKEHWKSKKELGSIKFESCHRKKDGKVYPVEVFANYIKHNGKEYNYAICRNIIERRKIEKSLLESRKRYKDLVRLLPISVFETDTSGKLTLANQKALETFGYSNNNFNLGKNVFQLLTSKHRKIARKKVQKMISGKVKGIIPGEYLAIKKNGKKFPVIIYSDKIKKNKKVVGFRGIIIDITEQKEKENLLKKQKERFNILLNSAPFGIVITDRNHNVTYANSKFTEITGYKIDEIENSDIWFRKLYPDLNYRKFVLSAWKKSIREHHIGKKNDPKTLIINCKNGKKKHINFTHLKTANKEILITLDDVTQQKIAEDELKKNEEKYRMLVENIHYVIYNINERGIIKYINPSIESILGYSPKEIIGESFLKFIHPDDFKFLKEFFKKTTNGKSNSFECRIIDKSGSVHWVHSYIKLTSRNENESIFQGVFIDITEKKKTERKLIESYKQLGIINRQIDIIFKLNKGKDENNISETLSKILSSSVELFQSDSSIFYSCGKNKKECRIVSAWGLSKKQLFLIKKLPFYSSKISRELERKRSQIFGNLDEYGIEKISSLKNFKYFLSIPLFKGEQLRSFIILLFKENKYNPNMELFGEIFSFQIYPILHRIGII